MEVLIIIGLVLLNGIFSMSEMSLVSSRRFKLESAEKHGNRGAKTALELSANPTKFLSTVQIGITLIGILLGVYGGENMTSDVESFLASLSVPQQYAHSIAVGVIVVSITYLTIVLGELLPKRLGMTFPEQISILLSRPMKVLSVIASPFVWLLTTSNNFLLRVLGIRHISDYKVSEDEIKSIIKESAQSGEIQDIEHSIVQRVFELGDRKVNSLLTHRSEVVFLTTSDSWEVVKLKINRDKHSAYPVSSTSNLDDVIGIVLLKDLFTPTVSNAFSIADYMRTPLFIHEDTFAYKVLEIFKSAKMHCGIVVDEFGAAIGIVTMDDVLDALVGEVTENDQEEYQIARRDDGSWLVDGQYSIIEFVRFFEIRLSPEVQHTYTTVAGLLIHLSNSIPNVGDKINIDSLVIEVLDKDGPRIDKLLVTKVE